MSKDKQQNASFLSGLIAGFSLGAIISYFSSEAGQKTWKKLSKNWQKARLDLYQQGLIDNPNLSLDEIKDKYSTQLKNSLLELKDHLGLALFKLEQVKNKKKARTRFRKDQKKKQFKGV